MALDPVIRRMVAVFFACCGTAALFPVELGALEQHLADAVNLRAVGVVGRLGGGVVLAVNGHPFASDHAGAQPQPQAEGMADGRMQRQGAMGLVAVQKDRDREDGELGQAERGQHQPPPGQIKNREDHLWFSSSRATPGATAACGKAISSLTIARARARRLCARVHSPLSCPCAPRLCTTSHRSPRRVSLGCVVGLAAAKRGGRAKGHRCARGQALVRAGTHQRIDMKQPVSRGFLRPFKRSPADGSGQGEADRTPGAAQPEHDSPAADPVAAAAHDASQRFVRP